MPKLPPDVLKWLKANQQLVNIVWERQVSDTNRMPTLSIHEQSYRFPVRQTYLLSATSGRTKRVLNRLFDGADHMVSTEKREGGHSYEGPLGYMWLPGKEPLATEPVIRGYHPRTHDHCLWTGTGAESGYIKQGFGGYAYRRSLAFWSKHDPRDDGVQWGFEGVTGSAVRIASSRFAGGALASLVWNGKDFVNRNDVGRLIQSSLNLAANRTKSDAFEGKRLLPTEGGDPINHGSQMPFWHGAPKARLTTSRLTQRTRSVPAEWDAGTYVHDRSEGQMILYRNMLLGKDISLDCVQLPGAYVHLSGQVLRYRTILENGHAFPDTCLIEIPTGYLNPELRQTFFIDATKDPSQGLMPVTVRPGKAEGWKPAIAGGAVLAADDFQFAMGVYGRATAAGGDVDAFQLSNFLANGTMKWAAIHEFAHRMAAGAHVFTTYIAVGTLDHVRAIMKCLYDLGL